MQNGNGSILRDVQKLGIKTSIDVVSDSSGRFAECVIPVLKYTDNAIMNEIEGCGAAALNLTAEDSVSGMKSKDKILEMISKTPQRKI